MSSLVGLLAQGKDTGIMNEPMLRTWDPLNPENPEEFRRSVQDPGLAKMTGLQVT